MGSAWLKASFLLPLPQADWAGQALYPHFPDGLAQLKASGAKATSHALFSGWLRRASPAYLKSLRQELADMGASQFRVKLQKPKDWVRDYKSRFPLQRLGHFSIVPSWRRKQKLAPKSIPIYLLPGQAFGTGLHASTRLMLAAIANELRDTRKPGLSAVPKVKPAKSAPKSKARKPSLRLARTRAAQARLSGYRVMDVGAGSGILSFAALKLGAAEALCIEIEEAACEEMADNAKLNGFSAKQLKVVCAAFPKGLPKRQKANLLLANLVTPLLCAQMKNLAAEVAPGGRLLFSGIHTEAEARKVALAGRKVGLKMMGRESKGNWFCLHASK